MPRRPAEADNGAADLERAGEIRSAAPIASEGTTRRMSDKIDQKTRQIATSLSFCHRFPPRGMNIPPVFMALALLAAATLSSQAVTVTVSSRLASTNVAGNQLTNASGNSTSQALPSGATGTISATSNLLPQNNLGNGALEFASATPTVSTAIFSTTYPANSNKPLRLRDFAHPTQGRSRMCHPSSASANLAERL